MKQIINSIFKIVATVALLSTNLYGEADPELLYNRVINISASFLDVVPIPTPTLSSNSIEAGAAVSFLPKLPESNIGSAPRVHGIPLFNFNPKVFKIRKFRIAPQVWMGTLIPNAQKLVGVSEKPTQYLAGGSLKLSYRFELFDLFGEAGYQYAYAKVENIKKPIESEITTKSKIPFVSLGLDKRSWGVWSSLLMARKETNILITTPEGEIIVDRCDKLDDAKHPYIYQISIGTDFQKKIPMRLSIMETWVSKRIFLPRIFISYYKEGLF